MKTFVNALETVDWMISRSDAHSGRPRPLDATLPETARRDAGRDVPTRG
jgi:hypothetical protein